MGEMTMGSQSRNEVPTEPLGSRKPTILLVEDEEMVRCLVGEVLQRHGYNVLICADANKGLQVGQEFGAEIDLILTDVVMPGMNGPEMVERILDGFPHVRVVFMSGYTEHVLRPDAVLQGGFHYLQKPFSLKVLTQTIARVLGAPQMKAG